MTQRRLMLVDSTQYFPASPTLHEAAEQDAKESGYRFVFFDEFRYLQAVEQSRLHRTVYHLRGRTSLAQRALNRALISAAKEFGPDVVLVAKGAYISPTTLMRIKEDTGATLLNFAPDDPFNPAVNTRALVESVPLYDLYACTKRAIIPDVLAAGCSKALFIHFAYRPSLHYPEQPRTAEEASRYRSDLVFVGGCDEDRVPFFENLALKLPEVNVHLYGRYWDRHPALRRFHQGTGFGRAYRLALSGTSIALNLVRRSNRDGHTARTFEIPACGAFMLAERTPEHEELFEDGRDVSFFSSPDEMVDKVSYYLRHERERMMIAVAARRKVVEGRNTYRHRIQSMLGAVEFAAQ